MADSGTICRARSGPTALWEAERAITSANSCPGINSGPAKVGAAGTTKCGVLIAGGREKEVVLEERWSEGCNKMARRVLYPSVAIAGPSHASSAPFLLYPSHESFRTPPAHSTFLCLMWFSCFTFNECGCKTGEDKLCGNCFTEFLRLFLDKQQKTYYTSFMFHYVLTVNQVHADEVPANHQHSIPLVIFQWQAEMEYSIDGSLRVRHYNMAVP